MTNGEKYEKEIINADYDCKQFIEPVVLKSAGLNCDNISCEKCRLLQMIWAQKEYKEPEVDWSKVAVDTPILVRGSALNPWINRYFSKYEGGRVYAFADGATSWSGGQYETKWDYAKLAESEV